jgi:hypothetical protein
MAANENNKNLMPLNKHFERVDVSAGTEMPPGLTSMTPLRSTPTTHSALGPNRDGGGKPNDRRPK